MPCGLGEFRARDPAETVDLTSCVTLEKTKGESKQRGRRRKPVIRGYHCGKVCGGKREEVDLEKTTGSKRLKIFGNGKSDVMDGGGLCHQGRRVKGGGGGRRRTVHPPKK